MKEQEAFTTTITHTNPLPWFLVRVRSFPSTYIPLSVIGGFSFESPDKDNNFVVYVYFICP